MYLVFLYIDHFIEFAECLGKEEVILQEIWQEAMGRYDRAMKHTVVNILHEPENPVETLVQSLVKLTAESSQQAAGAISRGDAMPHY